MHGFRYIGLGLSKGAILLFMSLVHKYVLQVRKTGTLASYLGADLVFQA